MIATIQVPMEAGGRISEASKGGMKDPLYKDYYLGTSHLPSPHLLRIPRIDIITRVRPRVSFAFVLDKSYPKGPMYCYEGYVPKMQ